MTCSNCDKDMTAKECNYSFTSQECADCKSEVVNTKEQQEWLKHNPIQDVPFG